MKIPRIPSSEITPKQVYLIQKRFYKGSRCHCWQRRPGQHALLHQEKIPHQRPTMIPKPRSTGDIRKYLRGYYQLQQLL